jgi:hypothetical protein
MANGEFLDQYPSIEEINANDDFEIVEHKPLFDDDQEPPKEGEPGAQTKPEEKQIPLDVISELLKEKGITDPSQIKFENEEGEEERVSFYDLPVVEQLEILKTETEPKNDLDDDEILFINYLRQNQLTPDELINHAKQQAIQEYLATQQPLESVASLSDDEVFLTDLLTRIQGITDEEAQQELDTAKQNTATYNKKVEALRKDLLEKETFRKQEEAAIADEEKKQSFETFKHSLLETAPSVKDIAGRIELDDEDISETIDFLLSEDATGTRYIAKALNDPASLIKMAWFYVKGEEAIDQVATYYESQIKEFSKNNYDKGYEDGKNGVVPTKRVATKPKDNKQDISQFVGIPQNPALIKKG